MKPTFCFYTQPWDAVPKLLLLTLENVATEINSTRVAINVTRTIPNFFFFFSHRPIAMKLIPQFNTFSKDIIRKLWNVSFHTVEWKSQIANLWLHFHMLDANIWGQVFLNMSRKQWKSHRIEGLKALFLYCLYNTDQLWITKLLSRISLFAVSLVYSITGRIWSHLHRSVNKWRKGAKNLVRFCILDSSIPCGSRGSQ